MSNGREVVISIDGEGQFAWLQHFRQREGEVTHLSALPRGMTGGRASVLILGKLKDGSYAVLQTSLRIMLSAFSMWQSAYGVEADGKGDLPPNDATRQRLMAAILLKLIRDREGQEVTLNIDELNAVMQDTAQDFEQEFGKDGKTITFRATRRQ